MQVACLVPPLAGLTSRQSTTSFSSGSALQSPQPPSIESTIQHFLENPEEFSALQQRNPEVAEALMSGDHNLIVQAIAQYRQQIIVSYQLIPISLNSFKCYLGGRETASRISWS